MLNKTVKIKLKLTEITFILCVSLFITLGQNSLFFSQAWELINVNSVRKLLFFLSMPMVLFLGLNIIFSLLLLPYIHKPVAIILILFGAIINYFMYAFGILIDSDMTQNVLETNLAESLGLISFKMILWITLLGIIPAFIVILIEIKPVTSYWSSLVFRITSILISVLIVCLIAIFFYRDYAPFFRNNHDIIKTLVPSNVVKSLLRNLSVHLDADKPFKQIGLDAKKNDFITQQGKKTLLILVVGETARAQNFSLAGYKQNTNPQLSQRSDITFFNHVSSCGTATALSVPCMFSNMPREDYSASKAKYSENVLDILARTNVNVLWRENDGGCKGVCERVPSENLTELNLVDYCQFGACLDEILLYQLEDRINQLDDDSIIILHQMGSHGPTYYQRYPKEYRQFTPTCDTNQIQDCDKEKLHNTYNNTIVYTDAVLNKTITLLEKYSDKFATAMIYLSDHGESLGEAGLYLHGAPYAIAPSQQTHIPMLSWMSADYRKNQHLNEVCVKNKAKTAILSQDNLFHSLLGIFNIQTTEYQSSLDIFEECRNKK